MEAVSRYIDKSLQLSPIGLGIPLVSTLADIAVSLNLARGRMAFFCVYRPPAPLSDLHFIVMPIMCGMY